MSQTIVMEQVSTEKAGIAEAVLAPPCELIIKHDGVAWYCTRRANHRHPVHAAHYEDDRGRSMVGVAWTEED